MRRTLRPDDGSIAYAMLLVTVVLGLSALLLPTVVTQTTQTRHVTGRVAALAAAQAGLDVALGRIRSARDMAGAGVPAKLPCEPMTGATAPGAARYAVDLTYLDADPDGHDADPVWLDAHRVDCVGQVRTGAAVPAYALLVSAGTTAGSRPVRRTLTATYAFASTVASNVPGGLVHAMGGAEDRCLHVARPLAGEPLTMRRCDRDDPAQTFAYRADLTLTLASAPRTPVAPDGMCLDVADLLVDTPVRLQPCRTPLPHTQSWSFTNKANFAVTRPDGRTVSEFCMVVQQPGVEGSAVVLGGSGPCFTVMDPKMSFAPEASVGAGAAGAATGQLVNLDQFGRCLDVTERDPGKGYLISYPCKQAPPPDLVSWNQRWQLPVASVAGGSAVGQIRTTNDRVTPPVTYCLRSPGTPGPPYVGFVSLVVCTAAGTGTTWTVTGETGVFATSYTVIDDRGYCLAPVRQGATADYWPKEPLVQAMKLVVTVCDGGPLQKWNAPPQVLTARVQNISER